MSYQLDPKLEKWVRWSDEVYNETQGLLIKTKLYDDYIEIVKNNPEIQNPRDFHDWVMRNYYESALMVIRRLVDTNRDCISLINLLEEIKCYYQLITKEFYLREYPEGDGVLPATRDYAEDRFDEVFSSDGLTLSQEVVEADISELKKQTEIVEKFIDNTLAHRNKGPKGKQSIETKHIRTAIQRIEEIAIKYLDLLGKGGYSELTPTWQYDPAEIFRKAWIS